MLVEQSPADFTKYDPREQVSPPPGVLQNAGSDAWESLMWMYVYTGSVENISLHQGTDVNDLTAACSLCTSLQLHRFDDRAL